MLTSQSICIAAVCGLVLASVQKTCVEYQVPLSVTSENFLFGLPHFENDFDVVDFVSTIVSRTAAVDFVPFLEEKKNQTASFTISGTLCSPTDGEAKHRDTLLLATHGLNFDRTYWHPTTEPETYSFVDFAVERGYSIFFYDRVGVSNSSRASGYTNQLSNQVAVALQLARLLKSGKYTGGLGTSKSLVLVGHSFGSSISAAAVVAQSDICDALILTGFSYNDTAVNGLGFIQAAQPRIAATQSAERWGHLDSGYLTPVDIYSNANTWVMRAHKTAKKCRSRLAEFLTFNAMDLEPKDFKGKAVVIAGQHDFIFCTGQCDAVIDHPAEEIFSKASDFCAVSWPEAGHGLNLALNAREAYKEIFDFLERT